MDYRNTVEYQTIPELRRYMDSSPVIDTDVITQIIQEHRDNESKLKGMTDEN